MTRRDVFFIAIPSKWPLTKVSQWNFPVISLFNFRYFFKHWFAYNLWWSLEVPDWSLVCGHKRTKCRPVLIHVKDKPSSFYSFALLTYRIFYFGSGSRCYSSWPPFNLRVIHKTHGKRGLCIFSFSCISEVDSKLQPDSYAVMLLLDYGTHVAPSYNGTWDH